MCRYSQDNYSCRYACFSCRKAFKAYSAHTMPYRMHRDPLPKCPDCGKLMVDMGQDFKPPRRQAIKKWRYIEELARNGRTFHSCGCNGPGSVSKYNYERVTR